MRWTKGRPRTLCTIRSPGERTPLQSQANISYNSPSGGSLFRTALILSLAVHAAITFVLWRVANSAPVTRPIIDTVEIVEVPQAAAPIRGVPGKSAPAGALGMKDLSISPLASDGVVLPLSNGDPSGDPATAEGDGIGGRGGNILGQMKGAVTFDELYRRIDAVLNYPEELKAQGYEGIVKAVVRISADGTFEKAQSRFDSASRYLRIVAIQSVARALATPLPRSLTRGKPISVRCNFQFDMTSKMNDSAKALTEQSKIGVLGNHLAFYRSARAPLQWKVGPVSGYGIVPSFGIDPMWFVDKAAALTSDKKRVDLLDKYRNDPDWAE